jgi:hypothetical protein
MKDVAVQTDDFVPVLPPVSELISAVGRQEEEEEASRSAIKALLELQTVRIYDACIDGLDFS